MATDTSSALDLEEGVPVTLCESSNGFGCQADHEARTTVSDFVEMPVGGTRKASLGRERCGYRFVKRAFDIAFSATVIVAGFVPAMLLVLAIRIESPGNPFYGQVRVGGLSADGKPSYFRMWKFRSMVKDADARLEQLREKNEVKGLMFKIADDPRVTRIGRFIRRHSIDEFPQFINVFLGQMSVVGPRPPLPWEVELYDAWAMQRLAVKPGLTGPWQVGGRSNLDFDDMVRLDLGYIAERGVMTDLRLIAQTVRVVVTGGGGVLDALRTRARQFRRRSLLSCSPCSYAVGDAA